jgi:hypothetical protein
MTKSKPQVKIVNAETGEEIIRDATTEEIAQMEIDAAGAEARKAQIEAKEIARQTILDRLGLTAEEAAILLS